MAFRTDLEGWVELSVDDDQLRLQRLHVALEAAGVATWDWYPRTGRLTWGAQSTQLLGGTSPPLEDTWEGLLQRVAPRDRGRVQLALEAALQGHDDVDVAVTTARDDGGGRDVAIRARVCRDVTGAVVRVSGACVELRREGPDLTAAAIVHDLSNLLAGVIGNAGLAARLVPESWPLHRYLEDIEVAGEAAADLCRALLLGRRVAAPRESSGVALNACVARALQLARPWLAPTTGLRQELAPDLPPVDGDELQLRQVLFNLLVNAAEALPAGRGSLAVATGLADLDLAALGACHVRADAAAPGRFVFVEVTDTGAGMDPTTVGQLFARQFTTKPHGHGLGLTLVAQLVREHGGAIVARSSIATGTTIRVLFPGGGQRP